MFSGNRYSRLLQARILYTCKYANLSKFCGYPLSVDRYSHCPVGKEKSNVVALFDISANKINFSKPTIWPFQSSDVLIICSYGADR